jgi:hypothetical protein
MPHGGAQGAVPRVRGRAPQPQSEAPRKTPSPPAASCAGETGLLQVEVYSVAERSFSLLHRVQMFVKPMAQLFLCNCR